MACGLLSHPCGASVMQISSSSCCPTFRPPLAQCSDLLLPGVQISSNPAFRSPACPTFRSSTPRHSDLLLPYVQISSCPVFRSPLAQYSDLLLPSVRISCNPALKSPDCQTFRSPTARRSDLHPFVVEISCCPAFRTPILLGSQVHCCCPAFKSLYVHLEHWHVSACPHSSDAWGPWDPPVGLWTRDPTGTPPPPLPRHIYLANIS
jgi:hypothetical protein